MRLTKTWPLLPLAGGIGILGQILYAAHRPDLPSYDNYETSGALGDPGRPGLRLVALGDSSITAPGVNQVDDAWIRKVAHALTDRYFVHLHALAVGGSNAADVLADQLGPALELAPDLAVVSVAANDAIRGVPPARFERELDEIVGSLIAAGAPVVVVGVGDIGSIPRLPRFLRWYLTKRSAMFDRVSADVAARYPGAVKVDVRGDLSAAFWTDPMTFSGDRFHASSYGHEHFAHHVQVATERALDGWSVSFG
ncbi:MAG: SGNH/GDSL hydrolase family protein [bacterium]|nr:SGNH/GDSL hydrolase family protein [bacterium]